MTNRYDMEDKRMKDLDLKKDLDLNQILEQFETFERVYPYYVNMLQDNSALEPKQDNSLKSVMKKEE
jgi:hypothetical protein